MTEFKSEGSTCQEKALSWLDKTKDEGTDKFCKKSFKQEAFFSKQKDGSLSTLIICTCLEIAFVWKGQSALKRSNPKVLKEA